MTETATRGRSIAVWGVLDQIIASGANFVFIVFSARTLSPEHFGSVALGLEIYLMAVVITRGFAGDTLAARLAGKDPETLRASIRAASGAPIVLGGITGLGCAIAAMFVGSALTGVLLVVSVVLPLLVLQDFIRQALIVQGRAQAACGNDLLWALLQIPLLVVAASHEPTAQTIFLAWATAGLTAAVVGVLQVGSGFLPGGGLRGWLREHRSLWPYLVGDNLVYAVSSFVMAVVISGVAGLAGLAAFRAAMTVYAPLSTIGRGVIAVGVTLLARRRAEVEWIRRSALTLSWIMAPVALAWGALFAALPDGVGEAAFGESWAGAKPLVFLASFPCAMALFSIGASCGIRALDAGRHGFGARATCTLIALGCITVGIYWDGVHGALFLLACSSPVQMAIWWGMLNGAAKRAQQNGPLPATEDGIALT